MKRLEPWLALGLLLIACDGGETAAEQPAADAPKVKELSLLESFTPIDLAQPAPQRPEDLAGLAVRTVVDGKGEDIHYGMIGRFHLIGSLSTGKVFRSTYAGEPEVLRVLPPMLPNGLAIAVDGMMVGERRRVEVPAEFGFGAAGDAAQQIPAHARLSYDVSLIEVVRDLKVGILKEGAPPELAYGQTGSFLYTGVLQRDGTVFDSTLAGEPSSRLIGPGVIAAWYLGLPGMKVGEKRRLVVPPALAYGAAGAATMGPNAKLANETLVFDVELLELVAGGGPTQPPR